MTFYGWTEQALVLFLLVTIRITGLLTAAPVFQSRNLPVVIRVGLAFLISLVLTPVLPGVIELNHPATLILMVVQELLTGLLMGFVVNMIFAAFQVAGQLIEVPMGFGLVNVLDPMTGVQLPLVGQVKHIISLWIFLLVDGHHTLIRALVESYRLLPVGEPPLFTHGVELIVKAFSGMFLLAFKIALPIVGVLFLTTVGLGILVRLIPQINVFMVGFPLKILVGLFLLWLSMAVFIRWFADYLSPSGEIWRDLLRIITAVGRGR